MTTAIKSPPRPLPASQPFVDLKRRVAEFVLLPRDKNALRAAGEAINDALLRMNTRAWRWSITSRVITVVADVRDYPIPTDFKGVSQGAWLDVDKKKVYPRISYVDPVNFESLYREVNPRSRESARFTVLNEYENENPLRLAFPVPSGLIERHPFFELSYYADRPKLFAENDTFRAPPEVELWVLMYARASMALTYSPERYSAARREAENFWSEIGKSDLRRFTRAR